MSESLLAALKRCDPKPDAVRLYQGEDAIRDLPVPGHTRKRWEMVCKSAAAFSWSHAELVDKRGRTLAVVQNADIATEIEDLQEPSSRRRDGDLAVMLRAQEMVLRFRDSDTKAAMQAMVSTMRELSNAVGILSKVYQQAIMTAQSIAQANASAQVVEAEEPGQGSATREILRQVGPAVVGKLMGITVPPPPPPPPGAPPKAPPKAPNGAGS